jgi:hypothetical protein
VEQACIASDLFPNQLTPSTVVVAEPLAIATLNASDPIGLTFEIINDDRSAGGTGGLARDIAMN